MNRENQSKRLTLTEMERKLLEDPNGQYRQELLSKLQAFQQEMQSHLSHGLPPDEFALYDQLKQALIQAQDVIINFQ
ncbi:MAG: hypothetical protein LW808_001770 [Verrucomicrobiota bacterium]|nr:MAG: hypothetical protein LW808_001770 [Verrucomicrobiota bacterium]